MKTLRLLVLWCLLPACIGRRPEPHETTLELLRIQGDQRAGRLAELEQRIHGLDRDLELARARLASAQLRLQVEHAREAAVLDALGQELDLLTVAEQDRAAAESALEKARATTAAVQADLQRLQQLEERRAALPQELAAAGAALEADEAKFRATRDALARRADGLRRAQETLGLLAQQFPASYGLSLLPESQPASRPATQPASAPVAPPAK